jgi:isoquinoline 1-oxidoreductase alpha subunit
MHSAGTENSADCEIRNIPEGCADTWRRVMAFALTVNGKRHSVEVEPGTPLLWVLRDTLGITGPKYGCGVAVCGTCSVLVDGTAIHSCRYAIERAAGKSVTTIEGLSEDGTHPLQRAWIEEDVPQCGFCQPGMIIAAAALLHRTPKPTDSDIDLAIDNLCRCGTYDRVRRAIKRAAAV